MFVLIILLVIFLSVGLKGLKTPTYTIQVTDEKTRTIYRQVQNDTLKSPAQAPLKSTTAFQECGKAYYPVNREVAKVKKGSKRRVARIIRGYEASAHSQPWLVSLRQVYSGSQVSSHVCGGALITDQHVLTAAHCVEGLKAEQLAVIAGLQSLSVYDPNDVYDVELVTVHEDYTGIGGPGIRNDIAVLKLNRKVTLTETIQTVCLPAEDETIEDGTAIVAGWGFKRESFDSRLAENLQIAKLKVVPGGPVCDNAGSWDPTVMLCVLGYDENTQSNICFGKFFNDSLQGSREEKANKKKK
jgi:secreted trypsin-like serine protease